MLPTTSSLCNVIRWTIKSNETAKFENKGQASLTKIDHLISSEKLPPCWICLGSEEVTPGKASEQFHQLPAGSTGRPGHQTLRSRTFSSKQRMSGNRSWLMKLLFKNCETTMMANAAQVCSNIRLALTGRQPNSLPSLRTETIPMLPFSLLRCVWAIAKTTYFDTSVSPEHRSETCNSRAKWVSRAYCGGGPSVARDSRLCGPRTLVVAKNKKSFLY